MATTLQFRRGNSAAAAAVTGANGEIYINTQTKTIHVHDGSTPGGFALASALVSGTNIKTINGTSVLGSGNITVSGGANLASVSTDIVPAIDSVYDVGTSTQRMYDVFVGHAVDINGAQLTGHTDGPSTILSTTSDFVAGSLLADNILISNNVITPDSTTATQYLGTKGIVVVNGNIDAEGDWIKLPAVQTTTTTTANVQFLDLPGWNIKRNGPGDNIHIGLTGTYANAAAISALTAGQIVTGSLFTGHDDAQNVILQFTYTGANTITTVSPLYWGAGYFWGQSWEIPADQISIISDPWNILGSTTIEFERTSGRMQTTGNIVSTTTPITTGQAGLTRYNKDYKDVEVFDTEWASISKPSKVLPASANGVMKPNRSYFVNSYANSTYWVDAATNCQDGDMITVYNFGSDCQIGLGRSADGSGGNPTPLAGGSIMYILIAGANNNVVTSFTK